MKIKNMKQVKEHMKDMNMKRLFRRNQIIITTLAVMIAAAGYLNYAGKKDLANGNRVYEAGAMDISDEDILAENQAASLNGQAGLQEIQSLDQDPSDLDVVSNMDGAQAAADTGTDAGQLAQAGDVEEATQAAADTGTDAGQLAQAENGASQTGLENPGEAAKNTFNKTPDVFDPKKYGAVGREEVKAQVKSRMRVCGCCGKG